MKGCGEKVWMENAYFICGENDLFCDRCKELSMIITPISDILITIASMNSINSSHIAMEIIKKLNFYGYKIVKNNYQEEDICEECIYACDNCEYSCDNCDYYFDAEEDPSDMNCDDCDQADDCDAYKK